MAGESNGVAEPLMRGEPPKEHLSAFLTSISHIFYILNRIYAHFSFCVNYPLYGFLYIFLRGVPPSYHTRPRPGYNPTIFVTGAGEGIGKATALLLARSGYTVYAGVLKREHGPALLELYKANPGSKGGSLHPLTCDVLKPDNIQACVDRISEFDQSNASKPFVSIINNAGFCMISPLELTSKEDIERMVNLDLMAYLDVIRAFLPLLKRHHGRVINIGSYGGYCAVPGWTVYNGVKAAIDNLARAWSFETTEPYGIRMAVVRPGFVGTEGIGPKISSSMHKYNNTETAIGFDSLGNVMQSGKDVDHKNIEHYERMMRKWKAFSAVATALGTPPEHVAKTVRDALTEAWMQNVYTVGWDALLAQMVRDFVPEPLYEWAILKFFT